MHKLWSKFASSINYATGCSQHRTASNCIRRPVSIGPGHGNVLLRLGWIAKWPQLNSVCFVSSTQSEQRLCVALYRKTGFLSRPPTPANLCYHGRNSKSGINSILDFSLHYAHRRRRIENHSDEQLLNFRLAGQVPVMPTVLFRSTQINFVMR